MIDILTDWLRATGTNSTVLVRSRVPAPWGVSIPARGEAMFHIVTEGSCWLRRPGEEPVRLLQGDLAILPHGLGHDLASDPEGDAEPLEEFLERRTFPAPDGPKTTLICGVCGPGAQAAHPMLSALPPAVHFSAASVRAKPSLASALSLLSAELERRSPGGEALIQHLFDALFVYVIRAWVEDTDPGQGGWLAALKDANLSKALSAMHSEPNRTWTVESLARQAGLSRAAFARRFAERVGEPPLTYLTRWRMGVAARLLRASDAPLAEVAARAGYESEFAFSRAFKREHGISPARFRREKPVKPGNPLR